MLKTKVVRVDGEWVVRAYVDGKRHPAADYFTTDERDARQTAFRMEEAHRVGSAMNGLNIAATPDQAKSLADDIDHIQGWPDDDDRVRFVFKDGRKSLWFSRRWELKYDNVKPI